MPDDAAVVLDPYVRLGPLILLGGMIALFACSRVLTILFARGGADARVGPRALTLFVPIAAASLVAMFLGRPEIAVGIVFGTSVGAVTSVIGFVAVAGPIHPGPPRWRRLWPFLLVASLLVFVAGFKGSLNWHDAVALVIEGMIVYSLWTEPLNPDASSHDTLTESDLAHGADDHHAPYATALSYATPTDQGDWTIGRVVVLTFELAMVAALLWLGGWAVTQGAVRSSTTLRGMSTSGLAASVVSIALVLPMMHGSWRMAAGGRAWASVTAQVGVVLLNLCALLPLLILLPYAAAHAPTLTRWSGDALVWHEGLPRLLIYPTAVWRIDNVLLIIMGVMLLPVALGKWALGREEGLALIAGYAFYLTATIATSLNPNFR